MRFVPTSVFGHFPIDVECSQVLPLTKLDGQTLLEILLTRTLG